MNRRETATILEILRTAYPRFCAGEGNMAQTLDLWTEMFRQDDVALVAAAVKALIETDEKGFPPHIGAVKAKLRLITQEPETSELEAWGMVAKALRNSIYGAGEEFRKLPPLVRRLVGSPAQLREWGTMDSATVHSVVASNFQRAYRCLAERERELKRLPPEVLKLVRSTQAGQAALPGRLSLPGRTLPPAIPGQGAEKTSLPEAGEGEDG